MKEEEDYIRQAHNWDSNSRPLSLLSTALRGKLVTLTSINQKRVDGELTRNWFDSNEYLGPSQKSQTQRIAGDDRVKVSNFCFQSTGIELKYLSAVLSRNRWVTATVTTPLVGLLLLEHSGRSRSWRRGFESLQIFFPFQCSVSPSS